MSTMIATSQPYPWDFTPEQLPIDTSVRLQNLAQEPSDHPRQYGISTFFQVSPTQVALLVNRRVTNMPVVDHEDGWDVFIIDRLDQLKPENAVPSLRNHTENHPATGEPMVMIHHLPIGGFVPLGAKLQDGSAHPHAGSGFGISPVMGHGADHKHAVPLSHGPGHSYRLLLQYAFDGEKLHITSQTRLERQPLFQDWLGGWRGLTPVIPDGQDLLFVVSAGRADESVAKYFADLKSSGRKPMAGAHPVVGECMGPVITRWRKGQDGWQIVEINRVVESGPDMATEPSLIRDLDGSLLCAVRSKGANVPPGEKDEVGRENLYEAFRVYRSTDGGKTWERRLCIPVIRSASPVTINQFPDGSPFIAACPTRPIETDSKGRVIAMVNQRQRMWVWPLTEDRRNVKNPLCVLDAVKSFGPPRPLESHACDNRWYLDHPLCLPVRLADEKWHSLFVFRVTDSATNSGGAPAAQPSGAWIMELTGKVTHTGPWGQSFK